MYSPPCEGKPVQIKWSPHWRAADWNFRGISSGHVAVGFMPAFKHNQRILLAVIERGHKAHGYVHSGTFWLTWTAVPCEGGECGLTCNSFTPSSPSLPSYGRLN